MYKALKVLFLTILISIFISGCGGYTEADIQQARQEALENDALSYVQEHYSVGEVFGRSKIVEHVSKNYNIDTVYSEKQIWNYVNDNFKSLYNANNSTSNQTASNQQAQQSTSSTDSYFVINKKTKVFHRPDCYSVDAMKESNKKISHQTVKELKDAGYKPCGNEKW